jgi:hypothetical protein
MGSPVRAWCLTPSHGWDVVVGITLAVLSAVPNFTFMPYYPSWSLPTSPLSTTFENGATATVENEATQTDWMGDLSGGLGSDPAAGRGRCSTTSGRPGSWDR